MIINGKYNQALEQRSYIDLEFPNNSIRRVPFFENLIINESKKANYVKYGPLGRSSPMYSYFGSDSRMFDIVFYISLDHVFDLFSKDLKSLTFPSITETPSELDRSKFFKNNDASKAVSNGRNDAKSFDSSISEIIPEISNEIIGFTSPLAVSISPVLKRASSSVHITKRRVIDFIVYWVNLIRSTTINNSTDVSYGPPIVRITNGILYQDVPCICLNYKVGSDENAGYDRNTLLPRRIEVSMSLAEVRHGDFSKYEAATPIKRDNIVGWESLLSETGSKSLDPIALSTFGG